MRGMPIAGLLVLIAAGPAAMAADPPPLLTGSHVRPLGDPAARLVAQAMARSASVRALVDELDRTDVVVYVSNPMDGSFPAVPACLTFVSSTAASRYLLVRVRRWGAPPWDQISQLAHELRHALEIAVAPEVRDAIGLHALYTRIGWATGTDRFESGAAVAAGHLARDEVSGFQR